MAQRISKNMLEGFIEDWNSVHEDVPLILSIYSGFYHIGHADTHVYFITEGTAGKAYNCFMVWKDGFHAGEDNFKTKLGKGLAGCMKK